MHERRKGDTEGPAEALPYSKEMFETAAAKLYQHRSLAWNMKRTSTVIFNSKEANWTVNGSKERSIGGLHYGTNNLIDLSL